MANLLNFDLIQNNLFCSFYIIMSGRTSVYIDTTKSDDDGEASKPEVKEEDKEPPNASDVPSDVDDDNFDEDKKKKTLDRSKYGKFIIHYGEKYFTLFRIKNCIIINGCLSLFFFKFEIFQVL